MCSNNHLTDRKSQAQAFRFIANTGVEDAADQILGDPSARVSNLKFDVVILPAPRRADEDGPACDGHLHLVATA